MYKKQMTLQRIVCYLGLVAAALVFVYSLGIMTDLYDNNLGYYAENIENPMVAGTEVYYYMQGFNQQFTTAGIVLILLAASQFVFQNHARRKYYIANYITVIANTVASVAVSVWAVNNIFYYKAQYLLINFEELKEYAEMFGFAFTDSLFWFDVCTFVMGFLLAVTFLNVMNLIWKVLLMKAEKKLLNEGKGV